MLQQPSPLRTNHFSITLDLFWKINKIGLTTLMGLMLFYPTAHSEVALALNVPYLMIMIKEYILLELNMNI